MNSAAFIVDGHLEQEALKKICPGRPVRRTNLNGNSVDIVQIAKRVVSIIRVFGNRHYPIVVCIDREDRVAPADSICAELFDLIREHGVNDELVVGVADRNIESWILADRETVAHHVGCAIEKVPENAEGKNGKSMLRRILRNYHETTDGVEMLANCSPDRLMRSPSFASFLNEIRNRNCYWLERASRDSTSTD